MNIDLLQPKVQQFIKDNTNADVVKLAFAKNPFPHILWADIINQIAARAKAEKKLPTWYKTDGVLFPLKVSVEQTSSEATAKHKSELLSGNTIADLTGGFGVDTYYFSKRFSKVFHCEHNSALSKIVQHNFQQLQITNIDCITSDGLQFLQETNQKLDWIYIDPSRRNDSNSRVFLLSDCEPDVSKLLPAYLQYSDNILIKAAPILDISSAISELSFVKTVHIVALQNEVKEVLFEIEKNYSDDIQISTSNIKADGVETFNFSLDEDENAFISMPRQYLYEPNAAIMKSGGFNAVATRYNLEKLHKHTHLYTSDTVVESFPGRTFKIGSQLLYNKNDMSALKNTTANITTRNFPDKVQDIRKRWKIRDGGDSYIFFTTDMNDNKIALICTKKTQ